MNEPYTIVHENWNDHLKRKIKLAQHLGCINSTINVYKNIKSQNNQKKKPVHGQG
jgi:hypothetical protein